MERQFRLCELLHYMLDSREGCTEFGALSNAVNIQKTDKKQVEYMSSTFEEYVDKSRAEGVIEGMAKGKLEIVKGMVDDGISLDKALEYAKLDHETYEAYPANESDK